MAPKDATKVSTIMLKKRLHGNFKESNWNAYPGNHSSIILSHMTAPSAFVASMLHFMEVICNYQRLPCACHLLLIFQYY